MQKIKRYYFTVYFCPWFHCNRIMMGYLSKICLSLISRLLQLNHESGGRGRLIPVLSPMKHASFS
ncbi:MAG: hypothetical protein C6W57_06115 [Caldibacillus debilis]|nr:MAG: hypothetical protein C6W57_06115 [Caldibacillus debilis]